MSTPTEYARLSGALNGVKEQLEREYAAHHKLRAAIEALLQKWPPYAVPAIRDALRALLTDDGVAALREHDAQTRVKRDAQVIALVNDLTRRLASQVPITADQPSWINGMATAFVELKKSFCDTATACNCGTGPGVSADDSHEAFCASNTEAQSRPDPLTGDQ